MKSRLLMHNLFILRIKSFRSTSFSWLAGGSTWFSPSFFTIKDKIAFSLKKSFSHFGDFVCCCTSMQPDYLIKFVATHLCKLTIWLDFWLSWAGSWLTACLLVGCLHDWLKWAAEGRVDEQVRLSEHLIRGANESGCALPSLVCDSLSYSTRC